jgi:hypothetical protein
MYVGRDMKIAHNYRSLPAVRFALGGRSALDANRKHAILPEIPLLSAESSHSLDASRITESGFLVAIQLQRRTVFPATPI